MTINKYLEQIDEKPISELLVKDVEDRYQIACPNILRAIISNSRETVFLEDEIRMLSVSEILNASRNLHVDFIGLGIIPFADCYDNIFAVYCRNGKWAKFNIVDECKFNESDTLEDLF